MLPHGGGAVGHGVEPGGVALLHQQGVRHVGVAVGGQNVEQIRRAHKAGGHAAVKVTDQIHKLGGQGRTLGFLAEVKVEDQGQRGLGNALSDGVHRRVIGTGGFRQGEFFLGHAVFHEVSPESAANLGVQFLIFGNVLTQKFAGLHHQRAGVGEESGCDEVVGGGAHIAVLAGIHGQPVAVVHAAQPQEFGRAGAVEVIHPCLHHGQMLLQQLFVAVGFVQLPGDDAGGIAPGGGDTGGMLHGHGNDTTDNAVFLSLINGHIAQPLFHELLNIEVDGGGAAEHLGVAGPAQTLVTLGAVGGDVQIVGLLTPDDVVIQLVDLFVAAAVRTGALHIGIDGDGGEVCQIHSFEGILGQPDVAEALEAVAGLEHIGFTTADIGHFASGVAVVGVVEVAVGIQHFAVVQHDAAAPGGGDGNLHIAGHILAKVDDLLALGGDDQFHGSQMFLLGDVLAYLGDHLAADLDGPGVAQQLNFGGLVHGLAVVDLGEGDFVCVNLPIGAGGDALLGAVGKKDVQPSQSADLVGKITVVALEADITHSPALACADGEGVVAFQQGGDVIGLILDTLFVAGPAGSQNVLANPLAVEVGDVGAHGGGAEGGLLYGLIKGELLYKGTGGNVGIHRGGDPDSVLFHRCSP